MTFTAEQALNRAADTFEKIATIDPSMEVISAQDVVFLLRTFAATVDQVGEGDKEGARSDAADRLADYLGIPVERAREGLVDPDEGDHLGFPSSRGGY